MGKKTKLGKQRKDKFYKLAKETGYRSRAAFKLLQLNRKHEFLQKSRVLIDLCAAPGGWLQVASQHTPVSSIIIGIDLVPIKPIPRVTTIQEDITTSKCRQLLKKELQTWKADCVLHDGAPNLGKNWLHDAFLQAQLTLSALKLASEFLRKGGWFVTKMFRSKDYNSMLWVFQQFFKKVFATKPQASRTESAEIFVVCQGYLAPDKIDPKFLDAKYVFAEVDAGLGVQKLDLGRPDGQIKKKAEGYPEGDYTLYHKVSVTEFIKGNNHLEILNNCSELVFDDAAITDHPSTTAEVKECCKDIKVLGRKDMRLLLTWRKNLKKLLYSENDASADKVEEQVDEEDEEQKIEKEIAELRMEELKDMKIKKKKVLRERRKLREKMNLKMILTNDEPIVSEDASLFYLNIIRNKEQLKDVEEKNVAVLDEHLEEGDEEETHLPRYLEYERDTAIPDVYEDDEASGDDSESSEERGLGSLESDNEVSENDNENSSDDEVSDLEDGEGNPLLLDLDPAPPKEKSIRKMEAWFSKPAFADLEDDDEDAIDENLSRNLLKVKKIGGVKDKETKMIEKPMITVGEIEKDPEAAVDWGDMTTSDDDSDDSDDDSDSDVSFSNRGELQNGIQAIKKGSKKDGFEVVPLTKAKKRKNLALDPEGLALGAVMIQSKKKKRDILELGWNRYTNNDENLPDWFVKDEQKHFRKHLPVTKEMVAEYRERLQEINARPIKKVVEAKARKKKRSTKKLDKARKKAEHIIESLDMTDREKMQQIKSVYKKAGIGAKPKETVTYVVSKKGLAGKRVRRPQGVKGRFRVVDPRMKKDELKRKSLEKKVKSKKLPKSKLSKLKQRPPRKNAKPKKGKK